jgi:hypothetical protein
VLVRQPAGSAVPAPGSGAASSNSSSEMVDAVKKAIKTINDGVTFGKKDGDNINIGVSGLTAISRALRVKRPSTFPGQVV